MNYSNNFEIYTNSWVSKNSVIHEEDYNRQQQYVTLLPLIGSSGHIIFVYDNEIAAYEEYIEKKISSISTQDHRVNICNEVFYTTKIEGAHTTIARTQEIHDGAPLVSSKSKEWLSEKMVQNSFKATKYLNIIQGRELTSTDLRSLWEITTDGVCDNAGIAGRLYRSGNIKVGEHEGVEPEYIESLMNIWLLYYNSDVHNEHPFIKAAILHYAFEDIHPFCDGNGRVGRLLMHNFLIKCGVEQTRALSFSKEIDATRLRYDAAFVDSQSEDGDCTPFVKYMMTSFALTIQKCIN